MDQDKAIAGETIDDLVDHPLAAEEDRPFLFLEWAQTRIGPRRKRDGDRQGGCQDAALAAVPREASSQERNLPCHSVWVRSKRSISN